MHQTAGSREGKAVAAGSPVFLSPTRSVAPFFPQKDNSVINHQEQSWKPSEGTIYCLLSLLTLCHSEIKYIKPTKPLKQALINSCSWALLLPSPCDWCLASLAVTNIDWSQTLNDFASNLFKDKSLVSPHKTCGAAGTYQGHKKRDASYLPTSSMTGAGHRRYVSSIPAGLSSSKGITKEKHTIILLSCEMQNDFLTLHKL